MDFLSAAYFDSTVTVASRVHAESTYALPAVNTANTGYSSGGFESYIATGQYAAGVRPGYGFHAAGNFGLFLYAQSGTELRIRSNTGVENTLWHSGNSRSDAQNDTRYSQLGHIHAIADVTNLQTTLDGKLSRSSLALDWNSFAGTGLAGFNTSSVNGPAGSGLYHGFFIPHSGNVNYGSELSLRNGNFYIRSLEAGTWGGWIKIASETYVTSQGYLTSASLTGYVQNTRQVNTSAGILGGGPLSSDLNLSFDTTFGDARYALVSHTHTASQVTDFSTAARALFSAANGISYSSGTGAFSLTYGTAANTVAQGNDSRIVNGQAAYARWIGMPVEFTDVNNLKNGGVGTWGSSAANRPASFGTTFTFVGNSSTGDPVASAFVNQIMTSTAGDWYVRYGGGATPTWGTTYQIWTAKQFNIANYATIASLSSYATVASLSNYATVASLSGYVPTSRTITINGVSKDLTTNQDWGTIGGSFGTGTAGFVPAWVTTTTLGNSSIDDSDSAAIKTSKGAYFGQGGSRWYFQFYPSTTNALLYFNDPTSSAPWIVNANDGALDFVRLGGVGYIMSLLNNQNVEVYKQLKMSVSTGTAPFQIFSTTLVGNLNADLLDGLHASSFASASHTHTASQITDFTSATRATLSSGTGISYNSSTGVISATADTRWLGTPVEFSDINNIKNGGVGTWGNSAANRPASFGTTFTFVGNSATGNAAASAYVNQILVSTAEDWYVRYGGGATPTWGTTYQIWTSKQFNIANYVPTSRTITVNGISGNLTTNLSLSVPALPHALSSHNDVSISSLTDGQILMYSSLMWRNVTPDYASSFEVTNGDSVVQSWVSANFVSNSTLTSGYYNKSSVDSMVSGLVSQSIAVNTTMSLAGGGNLGASRTLSLVNDSSSPGANKLYGTDAFGNKGWFNQPSAGGVSGSGTAFRTAVWSNSSTLTASSIMNDSGTQITISGHLVVNSGVFGLPWFSSDPSSGSGVPGAMYYNISLNRIRVSDGTTWSTI